MPQFPATKVTTLLVYNNLSSFLLLCTIFIATFLFLYSFIISLCVLFSCFKWNQVFHILQQSSSIFTYILNYKNTWLIWSDLDWSYMLISVYVTDVWILQQENYRQASNSMYVKGIWHPFSLTILFLHLLLPDFFLSL